jgi:DNA polymerase III subunit delta
LAKNISLSAESIIADIKTGKTASVYFLQGNEPFFIDQIATYIEKNVLKEEEKGFNQTIIYGKDSNITSIISAAKRFPMMSERQVVIVREAQELKDLEKDVKTKVAGKNVEFNALENYVKNPLASTILVFCYKYGVLDARKSITKVLNEHAVFFTSKGFYDNQLPAWIQKLASSKQHEISDKAALLLAEFIGNNLTRISNELDKIIVNLQEKTIINENHVLNFVSVSKEYNVFELQNALSKKDLLKCYKIVEYFVENAKETPVQQVLSSLYGYFSKLLLLHEKKPTNKDEAAVIIGVHPFLANDYFMAAKQYSLDRILKTFSYLREADLRSKGYESSTYDSNAIYKELIFKIFH